MSKILKVNSIQKNHYVINTRTLTEVTVNGDKPADLHLSNGKCMKSVCLNCKNPKCINIDDSETECQEFSSISQNMNRLVCPVGAISLGETCININSKCIGCGLCAMRCPVSAIYIKNGKAVVCTNESTSEFVEVADEKTQLDYLNNLNVTRKSGVVIKETDSVMTSLYKHIKSLDQEEQNVLIRNILIVLNNHCALSRKGNVYMRMDGFYGNENQYGVLEIETGSDMLDVSRALLDDIAVINVRYDVIKQDNHPLAVLLGFPNKRTDYWQVVKDIKKITGIQINSITFGALLIAAWNLKDITDFDRFYVDVDNSSIRSEINRILERNVDISYGVLGILETGK